jgi:hypothetical protein
MLLINLWTRRMKLFNKVLLVQSKKEFQNLLMFMKYFNNNICTTKDLKSKMKKKKKRIN